MDYIESGEDFVQIIEEAIGSCGILIAVIGRDWLSSATTNLGRLDNPNDFVRLEIVAALDRNIRVIPVLVQGANMPGPQDLPDDLSKLSRRQAFELSNRRWKHDVDQLIEVMQKELDKLGEANRRAANEEEDRRPSTVAQGRCTDDSKAAWYADFTKFRTTDATKAHDAAKKYLTACPTEEGQIPAYLTTR